MSDEFINKPHFTTIMLAPIRHSPQATVNVITEDKIPTLPTKDSLSFRNKLDPIALRLGKKEHGKVRYDNSQRSQWGH